MNNKRGLLIIIAGPSGVGKGTLREKVFKEKDLNLAFSVSLTTRKPRKNERNGVDYYFVSQSEFDQKIKENDFLEHAEFVGNCYGTCKSLVNAMREQGKNVVLEIEVNGTKQIIDQFKKDEVLSIFIAPPSLEELERRLKGRSTETPLTIKNRLIKAKDELSKSHRFDYVVINDDVNKASQEIIAIIRKEIKVRS